MKKNLVLIFELEDYGDGDGGFDYALFDREDEMLFFINEKKRVYGERFSIHFACECNNKIQFETEDTIKYKIKL